MRVLVLVVLLGCTQTAQEKSQDVCQAFCDCVDPGALPAVVNDCISTMCLPSLPPVSDPCLDCVFQHDQVCTDLFNDCTDSCFGTQTPKLGGM